MRDDKSGPSRVVAARTRPAGTRRDWKPGDGRRDHGGQAHDASGEPARRAAASCRSELAPGLRRCRGVGRHAAQAALAASPSRRTGRNGNEGL